MSFFHYKEDSLFAEDVDLREIIQNLPTPFYCYSTRVASGNFKRFTNSFRDQKATICYALKANYNLSMVKTLADLGAGADVTSGGELHRALAAGIPATKIVYSGVGKTAEELRFALEAGIKMINVESEPELRAIQDIARDLNRHAKIALRVNPNVNAETHDKISTGRKEDKFGIAWEEIQKFSAEILTMSHVDLVGIAVHIGSQLTSLNPFRRAFEQLGGLITTLRKEGHDIQILDLGGGLGVSYGDERPPLIEEFAEMVKDITHDYGCEIVLEPGRCIVAEAGILIGKVVYIKKNGGHHFAILDAAMTDLMRPALYGSHHEIIPLKRDKAQNLRAYDVVGPVCESSDTFAKSRFLPELKAGDYVAICTAGAYGSTMGSEFNLRLMTPEVIVNGNQFAITRPRLSYDDVLARETTAPWQENGQKNGQKSSPQSKTA